MKRENVKHFLDGIGIAVILAAACVIVYLITLGVLTVVFPRNKQPEYYCVDPTKATVIIDGHPVCLTPAITMGDNDE